MKINSYAIGMSSQSVSVKSRGVTEKAVVKPGAGSLLGGAGAAVLTLSRGAGNLFAPPPNDRRANSNANSGNAAVQAARRPVESGFSNKDDIKLQLIQRLLGVMTGKKYDFSMFEKLRLDNGQGLKPDWLGKAMPVALGSFERTETYYESQQMSFEAAGIVNTADGREIRFDLSVTASYEFSSSSVSVQRRLCDPLVINFDGALPEFTKDRYAFDITIDGLADNIFMPTNGSGFLALDKDGNGKIDDGSELFGASSGDGFWELSAYDDDGNGWLDEGDEIFSQLKIMSIDKDTGEFVLVSLKDSGVGAIYLGSAKCNYEIKGEDNELMGVVRKNGLFLNEDGSAGTIHHIDLTY